MAEATPKKSYFSKKKKSKKYSSEQWKRLDSVQDAESLRQDSVNSKHTHLITEIETSDGPLATTLR